MSASRRNNLSAPTADWLAAQLPNALGLTPAYPGCQVPVMSMLPPGLVILISAVGGCDQRPGVDDQHSWSHPKPSAREVTGAATRVRAVAATPG